MRSISILALPLVLLGAACPGKAAEADAPAAAELTRHQKDSLVATMPLPGAKGVGRAIEAQAAAAERARILDEESRR